MVANLAAFQQQTATLNLSRVIEAILMAHHIEHDADLMVGLLGTIKNARTFADSDTSAVHFLVQMLSGYARGNRDFINLLNCAMRIHHATKTED
jgi:hypothetical protein